MTPSIAAVVVAYNSASCIRRCLDAILMDPLVTQIAVVDNSDDPTTAGHVADVGRTTTGGRVVYLASGENLGFAAGSNAGVRATIPTTHIAFVNPDVELTMPLSDLARALDASGAALISAGLDPIRRPRGFHNRRHRFTLAREFAKATLGTRFSVEKIPSDCPPGHIAADQVDGALMVMRRATFDQLGGFDERFELYYEDVDLCRRAAGIGGCLFLPVRAGSHLAGTSAATAPQTAYAVLRISRARMIRAAYGDGLVTSAAIVFLALSELVARSATRRSESMSVRLQSVRQQWDEVRRPGSVRILAGARQAKAGS